MRVIVSGKQVETGEALKTHVSDGLAAISRKYFDHALEVHVTFRRNRAMFACDIQWHGGRNITLRGEGEGADAHRSFEVAAEHLAKQLRRYRRRVNEHARSSAVEREALPPVRRAGETRPRREALEHAGEDAVRLGE
ncbi:MAG TPA: ribosome-associated translation inhibitor RaiA [Acetobacteraceae bacterium]|nr:ribosome-associated translation inhibitor RaiA [Acetobacteraceae bacterium]